MQGYDDDAYAHPMQENRDVEMSWVRKAEPDNSKKICELE